MVYKKLLFCCCVIALVAGEDKGRRRDRKSRFISFDTGKKDIDVSLDFTVPFLSIPFKKTIDSMVDGIPGLAIPKINLNPSALAFGGFIILVTSVILPLFSNGLSTYSPDNYYRVLDNTSGETNIVMDFYKQFMSVSHGCAPRMACWMIQRPDTLAPAKTMEQIMRNKLVSSVFNVSSIEEAFIRGRSGHDCNTYDPCPIREEHFPMIMKNFGILTSRNVT